MLKSSSKYLAFIVGEGFSKGIIFVLLSFYTTYFSKTGFGKLALFWSAIPVVSVLVDFAQRSYIKNRTIYNDNLGINSIINASIFSCFALIFLTVVLKLINYFGIFLIDAEFDIFVVYCSFFFALIELVLAFYQIKGETIWYNTVYASRNTLPYILTFIYIKLKLDENSIEPLIFPMVQLAILMFITILVYTKIVSSNKSIIQRVRLSKTYKKTLISLKFSLPIIPGILSALVLSFADRFIINFYYGEERVAEYTVAYIVSSIFVAFFMATNKVWQKFILENLRTNRIKHIAKAARFYLGIILAIGIMIVLVKDFALKLISNEQYLATSYLIPPIILGMFFYFLYTLFSNIPFFYRNTFIMSLPAIIAAVLNIILNFIFIPIYGFQVAAYTTAVSYFFQFLIIYIICVRKYKIDILFNVRK